ncbi:IclR family transcriptional regulator [Pimelobacter simplex]|uniref:IclR family transcriptional regulator n=1 Tax=Nocardioides simplex TaxID=2045 RepID=UPI003AAF0552
MNDIAHRSAPPDLTRSNVPGDVMGRAMVALRAVADAEPIGAVTSRLATATGMARPTMQRMLNALLREGLVVRDGGGRWRLGPELARLGAVVSHREDAGAGALPFLRRLARQTGVDAFFSIRRGDDVYCAAYVPALRPTAVHSFREGTQLPLGVAAAGNAILAYLDDAVIEAYLGRAGLVPRYGTAHAADQVRGRVRLAQAHGYAVNPGLVFDNVPSLGTAVFDADGEPRWAIGLTGIQDRCRAGLDQRFSVVRQRQLAAVLVQTSRELSRSLKATG